MEMALKRRTWSFLAVSVMCFLLAGVEEVSGDWVNATCVFGSAGAPGINITGTVTFLQTAANSPTILTGQLMGFPNGSTNHGFHIHDNTSLGASCSLTGPHYNPLNVNHGNLNAIVSHVGDLGNIYADQYGNAMINITAYNVSLQGGYSVMNRALVVHSGQDDLGQGNYSDSNTTGHSGTKIGCCLITLSYDQSTPMTTATATTKSPGGTATSIGSMTWMIFSLFSIAYILIDFKPPCGFM